MQDNSFLYPNLDEATQNKLTSNINSSDLLAEEKARQLNWDFDEKTSQTLVKTPPDKLTSKDTVTDSLPTRVHPLPKGLPLNEILCGDSLERIREIPDSCVQLVITSPPYFNQRDYGGIGIGNEKTIAEYLDTLLILFEQCVRVLTDDGSLVFNLGDKYDDSSLLLIPYRFAIAATERFPVRLVNAITWVKQNPTPRQFRRRLVSSTEPFFHFVKLNGYFYNIEAFLHDEEDATRKPYTATSNLGKKYVELIERSELTEQQKSQARKALMEVVQEVQRGEITGFRMKIRGIHAEAFGGQEGGRKIQMEKNGFTIIRLLGQKMKRDVIETPVETLKGCPHPAIYPVRVVTEFLHLLTREGDLVLDPFMGSGSTAVACKQLNRPFIGIEINSDYCEYARQRVKDA